MVGAEYRVVRNSTRPAAAGRRAFESELDCIDAGQAYRPLPTTPLPIRGPQTAVVVGPKGEEIWTDQYGRVKGAFPLGPPRPVQREQLLLDARLPGLGGEELGLDPRSRGSARK